MSQRVYDSEKIKTDLSCRVVKPILFYLQDRYDMRTLELFIGETGLDLEFLENENNWVSFEYYNQLLQRLVDFTKNPRAPFEAGYYVLSKESYGFFYSILSVLKLFGSPKIAYRKIAEMSSNFSGVGKMEVVESGFNTITMRCKYSSGYQQTKLNCQAMQGQLAYIPGFWGLPPAEIEELKCQAEGDDSCIYRLKWKPVQRKELYILGGLVVLFIGILILYFFQSLPWIDLKSLVITALGFFGIYSFVWIRKYQKIIEVNKKLNVERSKALEESLESIKNEYGNLRTAHLQIREEAEKLSILKDIAEQINTLENEKDTIVAVINLIIERVGFDRGYCFIFNEQYELIEEPLILYRDLSKRAVDFPYFTPRQWEKMLSGLASEMNLSIGNYNLLNPEPGTYESLVLHLTVRNKYLYFIIFDNPYSRKKINPDYNQFFITISNQLKVALNKIYASNAAKNIISNIPSSIAVFDLETYKISFYNESFKNEILQNRGDLIGSEVLNVIGIDSTEFREKFIEQIKLLPKNNFLDDQELITGKEIMGYTLFLLPELSGRKKEAGIIMKNITSQKEMKEQLIRAEKMAALGTLVSGVAHEINNPLYGILGNAEIIRDEADSKEIRDYAETIINFTIHASDIVKDLSSYSRSMRDEKPSRVNLNEIMEEALRIVKYSKNFINIKVEKNFSELPPFYALGGEIRQIYINLFNNAVDAMKGKGVLTIDSSYNGNVIHTSVSDTGSGIPSEDISKIFDPFFTTKDPGLGTGMGLSIVYRLVTKYDGIISVRSSKGSGTVFDVKYLIKYKE